LPRFTWPKKDSKTANRFWKGGGGSKQEAERLQLKIKKPAIPLASRNKIRLVRISEILGEKS
jgi:hypothetical protein